MEVLHGFDVRWERSLLKKDEFNLVWVPLLGDVRPSGLNFQIYSNKKNKKIKLSIFFLTRLNVLDAVKDVRVCKQRSNLEVYAAACYIR